MEKQYSGSYVECSGEGKSSKKPHGRWEKKGVSVDADMTNFRQEIQKWKQ